MKPFILLFLNLVPYVTCGQNYGNIWYFGSHAGLDFNHCNPIILTNGKNPGFEGCSTISDSTGSLLFYTNSDTVWGRNHDAMPNGKLVSTTLSQVLIVPKPLSEHLFYIITTDFQAFGTYNLQYHVVDMSLNNGMGDVSSKYNSLSNQIITEQISATYHANGTDIWLMTHEYGSNNFLAFLLTSSGIDSNPIVSSVGPSHTACYSNMNARGQIKFSPSGDKVAFNANGNSLSMNDSTNFVAIADFDNSTGIVSNVYDLPSSGGEYGLSFSNDGSKLYGTTWQAIGVANEFNYLYQFDLTSGNEDTIANSRFVIDSIQIGPNSTGYYGDLKLGPDGKIYVINSYDYLGTINSPNAYRETCNYISNSVFMEGKICRFGLNNYIEYKDYCSMETSVQLDTPEKSAFHIYPNPMLADLTIEMQNFTRGRFSIRDIHGKQLLSGTLRSKEQRVNIISLPEGIYILTVFNEHDTFTKKIVKN